MVRKSLKYKKDLYMRKKTKDKAKERKRGIILITLVITILFSYDEKLKCNNNKYFLLGKNEIFKYLMLNQKK